MKWRWSILVAAVLAFSLILGLSLSTHAGTEEPAVVKSRIDFVRDIQPIFRENCYKCHGPEKQKAQLRFDSKDSVYAGGQSGKTIEPGHSAESRIIHRVLGLDGDDRMPLHNDPLSAKQIALLKAWIDQGAVWPDSASVANAKIEKHWAYVKPVRPALPAVKDKAWCRNPIDYFVLANLEQNGIKPAPEADRETLIRRVSLDLIGLPPTLQEVDDFVHDTSPNAYEKVVDRLLASPHYGERQAIHWLDLARYADSNGYEKDRVRSMWPYRDWVIDAYNKDMPFDRFTIEQLAGDLLPHPTLAQKIATGFNRNTMLNEEGGVDEHEYYYYTGIDRVDTTATVWLGTTLRCAQCHNHKYDPFTQRDFYRFLAYFNSTADETAKEGGTDPHDISARVHVDPPEAIELKKEIASLKKKLDEPSEQLAKGQKKWESSQQAARWTTMEICSAKSSQGATLKAEEDGSVIVSGAWPKTDTYTISAKTDLTGITAIRLEVLSDDRLPQHGPGRSEGGNFVLTHLSASARPTDASSEPAPVIFTRASADFSQDQYPVSQAIAEKITPKSGWAIYPRVGQDHEAVFEIANDFGFKNGTTFTFTFQQAFKQIAGHTIGRFRLSATTMPRPVKALDAPRNIASILAIASDDRSPAQRDELARYYRTIAPELEPIRSKISELQKKIDAMPSTSLVMVELPHPRDSYLHVRGGYLTLGEKVVPAIPAIFKDSQTPVTGREQDRLDLARWLASDQNPLTARVTVNRMWEQYFGTGIVATSEDFGTQGEAPSNQPLLDWLACEFMHPTSGTHPWSMKAIHKLIVMSAAYRQSSNVTPEILEKDPYNRLISRGARFRLPAELIRDQALAVSGLLSEKMGGPSVFPLQPDGIWHTPYNGDKWITSPGADRYRRGVYTFYRRSGPYPEFMVFDKTSHEAICTRRSRSDTPLQALTTLNDPAFVQPAAALARRILKEGGDTDQSRATFAFRDVLIRDPEPAEVDRLVSLYQQMLANYQSNEKGARELATSGLSEPPDPRHLPELAAWTMVSNVLLNLDETLTKE